MLYGGKCADASEGGKEQSRAGLSHSRTSNLSPWLQVAVTAGGPYCLHYLLVLPMVVVYLKHSLHFFYMITEGTGQVCRADKKKKV